MVGNYAKLIPYVFLGQLDRPVLLTAILISPAVPVGVTVGRMLHGRLDQDSIYLTCYALVLTAGCKMLFDAGFNPNS